MSKIPVVEHHYAPVQCIEDVDGAETGGGVFRFEAIVSEVNFLNRNRREYPHDEFARALAEYNLLVTENRAEPGLVDHPQDALKPSVSDIGVKWEHFWIDGTTVRGRGSVVPTQRGKDLQAVMEAGIAIGFSTRAFAEVEEFVAPDGKPAKRMRNIELKTIDAVVDPSVTHARVQHYAREGTEVMNEEELRAALEAANASIAEQVAQIATLTATVEGWEQSEATVRSALTETQAELVAVQAELVAVQAENAVHTLTARLHELTEGHRFAQTIINEARALNVSLDTVDNVVARLKALTEAAATTSAGGLSVSEPRGDVVSEEDNITPVQTTPPVRWTEAQLADQRDAGLITARQYDAMVGLLA